VLEVGPVPILVIGLSARPKLWITFAAGFPADRLSLSCRDPRYAEARLLRVWFGASGI
jgi:hypothetical protein